MQAVVGHFRPPSAAFREARLKIDDGKAARRGEPAHQPIGLVYARRLRGIGDMGREHQNPPRVLGQTAQQSTKIMVDLRERRLVEEEIVEAAVDDETARPHSARLDDLRPYVLERRAAESEAEHVERPRAELSPIALRGETVAHDGVARRPQTRDAPMQRDAKGPSRPGVRDEDQRSAEEEEKGESEKKLRKRRDHAGPHLASVIAVT